MSGDELDSILDDALASYSLQEPRAGLPARVMARVRADGASSRRGWWILAVAMAAVAGVAIAMVVGRGQPAVPPPAAIMATIALPPQQPGQRVSKPVARASSPRRLPQPETLSPEERAFLTFAQQAPEAARRLAESGKPLEIEAINVRPLHIDGLQTGELK